jgi:ribosomal 50S subunit-associated protein YjgA (DUF615 family)
MYQQNFQKNTNLNRLVSSIEFLNNGQINRIALEESIRYNLYYCPKINFFTSRRSYIYQAYIYVRTG